MLVAACDDNVGLTDSRSEVAGVLIRTAHEGREHYQKLKSLFEYLHESEPQPSWLFSSQYWARDSQLGH